ncbi:ribulose-phosphate 3-epimerase (plasmid) [Lactobacillus curvatus]|nr:ribulose-phosphate 3-epimerase [Latilactobacillus curvatus]MSD84815.1 ribulose-phosphate 3-epimerase [Latilactobacillus curvatus]MSE22865.1 ribulose-phosphate 3-epimerase [Latilactobacillus curvatus]MSE24959.1 ribulose-phosphate 3-epimerase [Latilactobacillus curvatus]
MKKLLCPSLMCADFSKLKTEVENLDKAGTDIFHIDFMDGNFVPNFGVGLQDFELVRASTEKIVDVHLMIQNPSKYVEMFATMGADIIYIHPEAEQQAARTLDIIRNAEKKAGIAINPGTSVDTIFELLPLVDYVMVMTVNPGFAGQKYLDYVNPKIEKLVKLSKEFKFEVMVDGAISAEKIEQLSETGVNGFVLGTSALFRKAESYDVILNELRKKVEA